MSLNLTNIDTSDHLSAVTLLVTFFPLHEFVRKTLLLLVIWRIERI